MSALLCLTSYTLGSPQGYYHAVENDPGVLGGSHQATAEIDPPVHDSH
jgi:hypothetical protein